MGKRIIFGVIVAVAFISGTIVAQPTYADLGSAIFLKLMSELEDELIFLNEQLFFLGEEVSQLRDDIDVQFSNLQFLLDDRKLETDIRLDILENNVLFVQCQVDSIHGNIVPFGFGNGWDIFNEPLASGSILICQASFPFLLTFTTLDGASPDQGYRLGLDVFVSSCDATPNFGQLAPLACETKTRLGEDGGSNIQTSLVYDVGTFTTDSNGNAFHFFQIDKISNGEYDLQFWISHTGDLDRRFQMDGNEDAFFGFGDTFLVTVE